MSLRCELKLAKRVARWFNRAMTPVFVDTDLTRVGFAKNILESAGISCFVQNENTRSLGVSVIGFSNPALLDPALFVTDDTQVEAAKELLREHFAAATTSAAAEWTCPTCKESNPSSFDECWRCQAPRSE